MTIDLASMRHALRVPGAAMASIGILDTVPNLLSNGVKSSSRPRDRVPDIPIPLSRHIHRQQLRPQQFPSLPLPQRLPHNHLHHTGLAFAKARKAIPVPLNGEAMAILQKQIGKHREIVFTFKGKRVEQVSGSLVQGTALRRAGIDNLSQLPRSSRRTNGLHDASR